MTSDAYQPSALTEIDAALVFDLRGLEADRADEFPRLFRHARSAWVGGGEAQRIADLWRPLPPGDQGRCHTPPYGIGFLLDDVAVAEASLCWECNNAFGQTPAGPLFFAFDASSERARMLLALLTSAMESALPQV